MLTVTRKILINAPSQYVSEYLRDIKRLQEYEPKVRACEVSYPDGESAVAEVAGRFLGLPWRGVFEMRWTPDGGFQSRMVRGPLRHMRGGFHVQPVRRMSMVTHTEQYGFPVLIRPLYPAIKRWLETTMERELAIVKEGAERLYRQKQVAELDGQTTV